jgi:hypothetical protein
MELNKEGADLKEVALKVSKIIWKYGSFYEIKRI